MDKAQSLRQHLTDHVPELKVHPDKLHIFIEKGNVVARLSSLNWEYRYQLSILVTDYAAHPDTLFLPIMCWVAQHQPALMQNPDSSESAIAFEADPIDHDKYDLSISLPLTEAVRVEKMGNHYQITHLPEPDLADLTGTSPWQMILQYVDVPEV